jgi:hypothetical protein
MWHHLPEEETPKIQASNVSHTDFHQSIQKSSGNGRSKMQNEKFITSSRIIVLGLIMKIW